MKYFAYKRTKGAGIIENKPSVICMNTARLSGLWTGNSEIYALFQPCCYSGTSQMFHVDPSYFICLT